MNKKSFYIILAITVLGCRNMEKPNTNGSPGISGKMDIPELLDRNEKLRQGKEWDDVQNFYAQNVQKLKADAGNPEAMIKLAECFLVEARITGEHPYYYPAAMKMLDAVIASEPKETDVLFRALSHQSSVFLSLHKFPEAKKKAEQAIAINPYNAYIHGCLVDANVELGLYEEAVAAADKMMSIRPDLRSYARVSYLRELYGDLEGAVEAMDMAVKAGYPGYEETEWARLQFGKLFQKKGSWKEAEEQFHNCLAFRPEYPFALGALAELEIQRKNYPEAEKLLKQAADIIPEIGFYIDLSKIYSATGRKKEAEALNKEILSMFEEDMKAGHNMALEASRFHLEVMNNPDEASKYAVQEYQIRPQNIEVNRLLADIYQQTGDLAQSEEYRKKTVLQVSSKALTLQD